LGDDEFDDIKLQGKLDQFGWKYACRTAANTILEDGQGFSFQDLLLKPGMCLSLENVSFTRQRYGPVLAVAWCGSVQAPSENGIERQTNQRLQ
jgi:hypothetical protein